MDVVRRESEKEDAESRRMSKVQRVFFVVGLLTLIALSSGSIGIVLYRAFPDSNWVTLVAPLGAAAAVVALRKLFAA
ncbi:MULTISPECIES: hypothetical protein [Bradyrhizobium]|uniref:Uncharacterized protein n=1 Tax=Bradyrhizobium betae TaxID=244734 RepID=A0AAE9NCW2_9BRAD|nr:MULTISPECIES: hypothetical protein [Bradyrhizobium]MDD1572080.1 hypothetical protein [Bradyrhizobium sp. WBOS1]UUO37113.1 hypothetical protein DCK84_22760 [Bradyrhizobium sp. WBOS01]MDD1528942.1 hypothetical protein [Bradyrhizobium sp. WBOS2]MDD1533997.1 hypothetical protein [Bradyrhizobium sp. WBOS8]MDD1578281.1 hypothetical protein [Bradyrhizobium sp. WBOS7]